VVIFFHDALKDKFDKLFTLYYSFSGAELYKIDEAYIEEILGA